MRERDKVRDREREVMVMEETIVLDVRRQYSRMGRQEIPLELLVPQVVVCCFTAVSKLKHLQQSWHDNAHACAYVRACVRAREN